MSTSLQQRLKWAGIDCSDREVLSDIDDALALIQYEYASYNLPDYIIEIAAFHLVRHKVQLRKIIQDQTINKTISERKIGDASEKYTEEHKKVDSNSSSSTSNTSLSLTASGLEFLEIRKMIQTGKMNQIKRGYIRVIEPANDYCW